MGSRRLVFALALCAVGGPSAAAEVERFDHRGSVGLLLLPGVELRESLSGPALGDDGRRFSALLGATRAVGVDGNELKLYALGSFFAPRLGLALGGGYRGYFGPDRVKSFFDLEAIVHLLPSPAVGPRLGFGVQYEVSPVVGLLSGFAVSVAGGAGIVFTAQAYLGLQLRSYLLE